MPGDTINTGIDALDKMLGGRGIEMGSTVLVRGGPGTGKTTLALQIINKLQSDTSSDTSKGAKKSQLKKLDLIVVFVSLEQDPQRVIQYANDKFGFTSLKSVIKIGPNDIDKELNNTIESNTKQGVSEEASEMVGACMRNAIMIAWGKPKDTKFPPMLVVIDSLNVLANLIQRVTKRLKESVAQDIRDSIRMAWEIAHNWPHEGVVIFTGEYDPASHQSLSVASESYFCDIDIQLSIEPVVRETISLEYALLHPEDYRDQRYISGHKGVERRFFCRVKKCRCGQNQFRRCAYDIVNSEGLKFYETYPGDGQIMFFAENEPQRAEWKDFITRDLSPMYLYPAADSNIFDRSGLQRTFTSLRRFLQIPERTDMYLSSFDTYWVNSYVELYQRLALIKQLCSQLDCYKPLDEKMSSLFYKIVGKIHTVCIESLLARDEKGNPANIPDGAGKKIREEICRKECPDYDNCPNKSKLQGLTIKAYENMKDEKNQTGLLHPFDIKMLRLFGERKSEIIKELHAKRVNPGPPYIIQASDGTTKIFAVPYNANVSFIVYRKDLLELLKGAISADEYEEKTKSVFADVRGAIEKAKLGWVDSTPKDQIDNVVKKLAKNFREDVNYVPQTWEEVVAMCELGSKVRGKKLMFLIETRTFDTIASTLLEIIWGTGKSIRILPDYSVESVGIGSSKSREVVINEVEVKATLFQAVYLLYLMYERRIIPRDCSLEPEDFASLSARSGSEWLFARHWYSTFVDVLTARRNQNGNHQLIWQPTEEVEMEIMTIPVMLRWYNEQWVKDGKRANFKATHVSCWGEWYWGVMKGTENEALAVDLINNLMSSRKMSERAASCAGLPTVEEFYKMYGDASCFNLPERGSKLLPKITYKNLREDLGLFKNAKFRTDMFDYRHTMRELHGLLEYVRATQMKPDDMAETLGMKIQDSIERIKLFAGKGIWWC